MSITSKMVEEHEMAHFDYEQFHREQYNILNDYDEEEYQAHLLFEQCRNEEYEDDGIDEEEEVVE